MHRAGSVFASSGKLCDAEIPATAGDFGKENTVLAGSDLGASADKAHNVFLRLDFLGRHVDTEDIRGPSREQSLDVSQRLQGFDQAKPEQRRVGRHQTSPRSPSSRQTFKHRTKTATITLDKRHFGARAAG